MLNITAGTDLVRNAFKIAYGVHKDQQDKAGMPYILHILHVASNVGEDERYIAAALLHDTVEDSDMTFDDLREAGIPEDVLDALILLTHKSNVPYLDYVKEVKKNDIARAVKLADLDHNMDIRRLLGIGYVFSDSDYERMEQYKEAEKLLRIIRKRYE